MNHMLLAAALLSPVALALPANAQKAAIIQDVDEPGRNPYQAVLDVSCRQSVFLYCNATLPAVPAGRRLVVTFASVRFLGTAGVLTAAFLGNGNPDLAVPIPGLTVGGGNYTTAAGAVTYYVDGPLAPTVSVLGTSIGMTASVIGHLISIP